jgi:hypothetical protein
MSILFVKLDDFQHVIENLSTIKSFDSAINVLQMSTDGNYVNMMNYTHKQERQVVRMKSLFTQTVTCG